ncbi:MAG: hypothetical protein E7031_08930 [Akkermansiaceae bacterium]|nr:hypothetical protein [Akkermansiaceae bacterium]
MRTNQLFTLALLAAAGLSPITQAQEETVAPATVAPAQLNIQCTALSKMPANIEAWAAINIDSANWIMSGIVPDFGGSMKLNLIDSAAVGITEEAVQTLEVTGTLINKLLPTFLGPALKNWLHIADPQIAPTLGRYINSLSGKQPIKMAERNICKALISTPLPGSYVVISFKPGGELIMQQMVDELLGELREETRGYHAIYQRNGWKGVRFYLPSPASTFSMFHPTQKEIQQLAKRSYYVVTRIEGTNLIIATTENPAKLVTVSGGAPALINTNKVAHTAVAEQGNLLASFYVGQDFLNASQGLATHVLEGLSKTMKGAFYTISHAHPAKREDAMMAIAGIDNLFAELSKGIVRQDQPLTGTAWHDGDLHLEISCDAGGIEFTKAKVDTHVPQDAILHAYGSTLTLNNAPSLPAMHKACTGIITGFATTLPVREEMALKGWAYMAESAPRIATIMAEPLLQMYNSLGNGWTFTMNAAPNPNGNLCPIISGSITLNDRAAFEKAWYDTRCIMVALAAIGGPHDAEQMAAGLTFEPATKGNTTIYTSSTIVDEYDCVQFAYALSDTKLSVSSNSNYLESDSTATTQEFAGVCLTFNPQAVLNAMEQQATVLEQKYKDTPPRAQNDNDMYLDYNPAKESYDRSQRRIREWKEISRVIQGAQLNITTQNGQLKLKLDLATPTLR